MVGAAAVQVRRRSWLCVQAERVQAWSSGTWHCALVGMVMWSLNRPRSQAKDFPVEALEYKTSSDCPYLTTVQFKKIFIYHSQAGECERVLCAEFVC